MSDEKIILEIPLVSYQFKDNVLYLCLSYKNNFKDIIIQLKELNKNCEICSILFEEKKYMFNFEVKKFICINCFEKMSTSYKGDDFLKINIKENSFNQFFIKLTDFQNNFNLLNETHKKFYVIFSYFFELFKILKSKELYNKQLYLNLVLISQIKLDKIILLNDNYNIILVDEKCIFLFNQFYNDDYKIYYNSNDLLENYKLLKIYQEKNISINDIDSVHFQLDMKFLIKNKENRQKEIINSLNNYKLNIIPLITININISYESNLEELRNVIKNFFSKKVIIPSIYLLKRKFAKLIIDNLYSIYYDELEDVDPNYNSLYFFYYRIYNSYFEIKDDDLKIKIKKILTKILKLILDKLKKEQIILKEHEKFFDQVNSEVEFNNIEIKEIQKVCSFLEKKRRDEKCVYTKRNTEYIILKFTINFLNFIRYKSNFIIHILLDKYSEFFNFIEIKNRNNLIDFIKSILDKDKIQDYVKKKDLVNFFFQETEINNINNIMDKIQELLINDKFIKIENKNDKKRYSDIQNEIIKNELSLIKIKNYYDSILQINVNQKEFLGVKEYKYIKNYNKIQNQLIFQINNQLNSIKNELNTVNLIKKEIFKDIDNIIFQDMLIEKIKIITKEIESNEFEYFSLNILFNQWKKKEYEKIQNNLEGNIQLTVIKELNNFEFINLKDFLIQFYTCYNKNIEFYEEETDLNLNLFLYKNKINPHLGKLNYKLIEIDE